MEKSASYQFTGIIPARYASSRFPGKPLVLIGNKTMIQRVYEQASKSLKQVYVATDDERISDAVNAFGGNVIMTSADHQSGTDRCAEAVEKISTLAGLKTDIVINIQGDEPFIKPEQINTLINCFDDYSVELATLIRAVGPGEDIFNSNQPKVITDKNKDAIYFSRTPLPYIRDMEKSVWTENHMYYKHIGLYAYKADTLKKITKLPRSPLEIAESLEQNRWIENGYKIRTAVTEWESIGIDTPEDLKRANKLLEHFF
jgi:3-deoxy-manno-octulosonate cytidylyltransferase (CMP-KDO synthetase)